MLEAGGGNSRERGFSLGASDNRFGTSVERGYISHETIQQQKLEIQKKLETYHMDDFLNVRMNHDTPSLFCCKCTRITQSQNLEGEFVLTHKFAAFFQDPPSRSTQSNAGVQVGRPWPRQSVWPFNEIRQVEKRRFLLRNQAFEIFTITGKTALLAFGTVQERDTAYGLLLKSEGLVHLVDYEQHVSGSVTRPSITQKWQRGQISNFSYLMHLNTMAGRSFNDLTQYPVYPWVLSDYDSEVLTISPATPPSTFRDLFKPIGAQDPNRLAKFREKYRELTTMPDTVPFLFGSHYSNMGSVLHFLVRIEPLTTYFLEFQGGRFDVPDRAFHSIGQTWRLSSSLSSSDVKELIPEFFYLPEFLLNSEKFDLGLKQDGVRVDNVILPRWAHNDARKFIQIHREALECEFVSLNLHHWIDLIFGYKQTGPAALEADNIYHPLTYEGAVELDNIEDEIERAAALSQIQSFGQTPKQIFKKPHPARSVKASQAQSRAIWSSPHTLVAMPAWVISGKVGSIAIVGDNVIALGPFRTLLLPEANDFISWGHWDQNLRVSSISPPRVHTTIHALHDDNVLCAAISPDGRTFATGGSSGTVKIYRRETTTAPRRSRSRSAKSKDVLSIELACVLHGHCDAVEAIAISQEWGILVTGSRDQSCSVWDLNRRLYVRSIATETEGTVRCITICPTTGTIATAVEQDNGSLLRQHSINCDFLSSTRSSERILCMMYSSGILGVSKNVLVCGTLFGTLIIYDALTLQVLARHRQTKCPITSVLISSNNQSIFTGDAKGRVYRWQTT